MKLPNPRAPAQPKPPLKTAQPEQLSKSEAKKLDKAGQRDGHHSLPKQDEEGVWTSPLLQKEADAYDESCVHAWGDLQEQHERTHKEIIRLCQEYHRLEERLAAQRRNAPAPADLTVRLRGEELHSEKLIRTRRQREFERENAAYFTELKRNETALDDTCRRLSDLQSTVQAAEKSTAMLCEQGASRALKRATIYWNGALRSHPLFDSIPPTPEISLESDAEANYFTQNRAAKEEAARILSRYATNGGLTANIRRMEDRHYAPKQKQSRK